MTTAVVILYTDTLLKMYKVPLNLFMCILTDVTPTKADITNDLTITCLPAH